MKTVWLFYVPYCYNTLMSGVVSVRQLLLLGTEDGLYSLSLSEKARPERRVRVEGFPPVLMMKQVPELDQLVFICGEWRSDGY